MSVSTVRSLPLIHLALLFAAGALLAISSELPLSGYIHILLLAFVWRVCAKEAEHTLVRFFNQGLVFGLGYFIVALWWIFISLHDVGGISTLLSSFAVFALAGLMAIYVGLAFVCGLLITNPLWRGLALPSAWVMAEYLRGQLFTGFPWMGLAESQVHGPFIQIAPYLGGLACTFLVVWASWQISLLKIRNALAVLSVIAITQILGIWQFTSPSGSAISVRLIQGNFEQSLKFNPKEILRYHLVPFGEFIPPGFQWFVDAFKVPMSNFARGSFLQAPFTVLGRDQDPSKARYAAISICYEDIFGNEIASRLRQSQNPVNLLINVTNLAWFGQSQAPMQQLRLSQLRSIETGLPSLRATNTGITAIIDHRGEVQTALDQFVQGELSGLVQPYAGQTPYVIWGNWPILLASLFLLLSAYLRFRK
ncbi:MAG: apolipoprotein N-acyltransferase [Burkholderiaceae bacterium]|nr:apolipoprotein N-acyltransferase [Burkholderiaceae bacterium]